MINIISLIIGYLLGSINASIIISKFRGDDIRHHGSGNAGATNTLRTYGKGIAALVTLFDIFKGIAAVLIARYILKSEIGALCAGLGAVLGHNFPLYFGFKGGKGILTSFAVILMISPLSALCALVVAIILMATTKYVSLGSVMAAVCIPIFTLIFEKGEEKVFALMLALALLAIFRHRGNIVRLIKGTERKLGEKKQEAE